jgi:hypothetical protein
MCCKKENQLKPKELKIGNKMNIYEIHLLKLLDNYNMLEFDKQPTTTNEEPLHNNWVGLFNNSITTQLVENN